MQFLGCHKREWRRIHHRFGLSIPHTFMGHLIATRNPRDGKRFRDRAFIRLGMHAVDLGRIEAGACGPLKAILSFNPLKNFSKT